MPEVGRKALVVLTVLIFISGCASSEQPVNQEAIPVFSLGHGKPAGRLLGVNHLFTITGNFSQPAGISVDAEGNIYVADSGRSAIHVLDAEGRLLESIGRFGWRSGEFDTPSDVALDAKYRVYIADSGNNRIQKFGLVNRIFSIFVGGTENETAPTLYSPQSVATDVRGYVFIADTWNHRVLKFDPLGRLQMEIGGVGWSGQGFMNPLGITLDSRGNIYIADTGNNRIHKLDFSGSHIAIWGEEGHEKGKFQSPAGLTSDKFNNIYIADRGNHRVQIFSPAGDHLMEFGLQFLEDPIDVAVDASLRVYVTDAQAGDIEIFKVIYEMAENIR